MPMPTNTTPPLILDNAHPIDMTYIHPHTRTRTQTVSLGDATTFGGVLSRLGIASGERMLPNMPPFEPDDYLVQLDACVPRRCQNKFFRHAYLCLLDYPNDRQSIYRVYKAMRGMDLPDSRSVMMPLIGFDFRFAEDDLVYKPNLGDKSRRKVRKGRWLHSFIARPM